MKDNRTSNYKKIYRKKRSSLKKNFLRVCAIIIVAAVVLAAVLIMSSNAVKTHASSAYLEKYYQSITIKPGDTLWSIAEEYMEKNIYSDARAYIKEVKEINSLSTDDINSGCHLIIPCYSESVN